jgi:hypothetical protein
MAKKPENIFPKIDENAPSELRITINKRLVV